ncbi:helix-turn-helix transcriptional regulator [Nonomuraea sp. NPDC005692]|uniref:helix-turn-helix transcriptional regulator n=1 Tax=Nonomuraea sp. NPDC005692 TaxID=3157168 RepID=UPI0033D52675
MSKSTTSPNRVRKERDARGWSQTELARELIKAAANDEQRPTRLPSVESLKKNIYGWETGKHETTAFYRRLCSRVFNMPESELFGGPGYDALRQSLDDVLVAGSLSEASLGDWERTVLKYGHAAHYKPAGQLVHDLGADLTDLRQTMIEYRAASSLRRLTRVTAHMAGLMCLTYIELDDHQAFRRWARTARRAAQEAGDPWTRSWVLAQEAYGHFYTGDLLEAIDVAQGAQHVASACSGRGSGSARARRSQPRPRRSGESSSTQGRQPPGGTGRQRDQ